MATAEMSVEEQLKQLDAARKLVLGDSNYYPQIIQGILPIIGPNARVELRRWGSDFLAESFATPALPAQQKETLSLIVLENLKSMIENENEDISVVKSVILTAASVYPHVFRWIINNPYDTSSWERMTAIKSRILRLWGNSPPSVHICCIKFAQRLVLVGTMGPDGEPKRNDVLGTSLAMVPQNHSLIPPRNLEAEASGLLDRMLSVLQENATDPLLVDATLNCLAILIRARPVTSNRILNAILNFNPLKLANSPMTPKIRVVVKSMERTTRLLLIHISKRDPQHPLIGRIHQYLERLIQSQSKIFDEALRKRGPPDGVDGLDLAKRQRLGVAIAPAPSRLYVPPLPAGPVSVGELFTITADKDLRAFNVAQLSLDLVTKMNVLIISSLDPGRLSQAVEGVQQRLATISQAQIQPVEPNASTLPLDIDDDDDDYEPDFQAAEDTEQILNKLDSGPPADQSLILTDVGLGPFKLAQPPPITQKEANEVGQNTVARVFGMMQSLDETVAKKSKAGINRMAASSYDRDAWITVLTRLATRATAGLEEPYDPIKFEDPTAGESLVNSIRNTLYRYIIEDFRRRIDVAVSWLTEEWYNDQLQKRLGEEVVLHYDSWALKVLDGFLPYVDARDKVLTRFLSEIPGLSPPLLDRVKRLCRDPSMVNLVVTSLLYLVMMRPPAREMALDAVEDVWRTYDDAKPIAEKYLKKWRPGFIEAADTKKTIEGENMDGTTASQPGIPIAS